MVYEDEEPDVRDPNYDESAQVSAADLPLFGFCTVHRLIRILI